MNMRMGVAMSIALLVASGAVPAAGQEKGNLPARLKEVQASPSLHDPMYRTGRKVAAFCANCHGDGGNSVKPDVPNLAGQNAYYLLQQLREFGGTQRKTSEFKRRLVNAMSADEKVGMVVFYAAQEVTFKPSADPAMVKRGERLYAKSCADCHEGDGRGTSDYSRIAGQQTVYLTQSLKGYRDGTGPRLDRQMALELKSMSDADIAAIVAFVSSMK